MLLGVAWFAWFNKRLDISEHIIKYALTHFGVMGKGTGIVGKARINIRFPLLATFAWISYRLGGPSRWWLRWIPADYGAVQTGYRAHLQVLHILLRRNLTRDFHLHEGLLKKQMERQPNNPLFAHAAGADKIAKQLLSDPWLWPENRLPNRGDRKAMWLLSKDFGDDWRGTAEGHEVEHYGGDFIFCKWLIDKGI